MARYNPSEIEKKWRKVWEKEKTFKVDLKSAKNPFYNLMMFPYPSGEGVHVGHVYAFGGADTYGRLKRLQGKDVFEPMGFDSFGIHSENFALKSSKHPKELIAETTTYFREEQLKKLGTLFDWDHQVITSDSDYYRWTQWLFVQLFKAGLAVRKKAAVDWCPACKTVLANEQVISGECERCGGEVIQKELEQWFFKITDYAERLLNNLEKIDWSETTKTMQRNWIGRSDGALIEFKTATNEVIEVFTTRPDTLFGATFMVLAPEHPLALKLTTGKNMEAVEKYIKESQKTTEIDRVKAKTGVFTGSYCINPLSKKEIPVWIADYVLMGYGTGAIMAVPAHDERDFEFAKKYDLPIVEVLEGGDISKEAYIGEGTLVNSGQFNGLGSLEAIDKVSKYIEENHFGKRTVNYHLRDWLISRQRYWGPPIPMVYCEKCAREGKSWFTSHKINSKEDLAAEMKGWYPVPEKDLPVLLPDLEDYQPKGTGVSPLASLPEFVNVKCPECSGSAKRETDVSDTFLDSSWYFLRYPTVGLSDCEKVAFDSGITKKWLPVDSYIGGNEHAVLHLLYTRFVTMALQDIGLIDFEEPFKKFRAHGLIIYKGAKMSKSRGNVVNPNEYIDAYGADALRIYLLFIGPYDLGGEFSDRAIAGVYRFLKRAFELSEEISKKQAQKTSEFLEREVNKLVKKVAQDVESLRFNTAIAALMGFLNTASSKKEEVSIENWKKFVTCLSIFAPFTSEELWEQTGEKPSVHNQTWPKVEEKLLKEQILTIPVMINGKLRDTLQIEADKASSKDFVEKEALKSEKIKGYVTGKEVKKVVYVPGKVLNLVL